MPQFPLAWILPLFIFGLIVGSFLNVCIYRIPKNISIVWPSSSCPHCKVPIRWYDNVPLLSFIVLRGKCRNCRGDISPRYPVVEFLSGLIFSLLFYQFVLVCNGDPAIFLIYSVLCCALIVSSFIDLELLIIPNEITYPGMLFGPITGFLYPTLHHSPGTLRVFSLLGNNRLDAFVASLVGLVVGGGITLLFGILGRMLFGREAMGMGDVKLMAMVGGVVGWKLVVAAFFVAPFFALIAALPMLFLGKGRVIPYAPFLSLASLVCLAFQDPFIGIMNIYESFIKQIL